MSDIERQDDVLHAYRDGEVAGYRGDPESGADGIEDSGLRKAWRDGWKTAGEVLKHGAFAYSRAAALQVLHHLAPDAPIERRSDLAVQIAEAAVQDRAGPDAVRVAISAAVHMMSDEQDGQKRQASMAGRYDGAF